MDNFDFPKNTNYKSNSDSYYFYTDKGVYRKSNHWGRVANCRWKLITNQNYKNQKVVVGFAKWMDFHPINSSKKIFTIAVDFDKKTSKIQPKQESIEQQLFTYSEVQQRVKKIKHLFKEEKWANYFDEEIEELRFKIITKLINTKSSLQEIKKSFK